MSCRIMCSRLGRELPAHYDVVVNTNVLIVLLAARLVASAAGAP